jgi:hypothetical protein
MPPNSARNVRRNDRPPSPTSRGRITYCSQADGSDRRFEQSESCTGDLPTDAVSVSGAVVSKNRGLSDIGEPTSDSSLRVSYRNSAARRRASLPAQRGLLGVRHGQQQCERNILGDDGRSLHSPAPKRPGCPPDDPAAAPVPTPRCALSSSDRMAGIPGRRGARAGQPVFRGSVNRFGSARLGIGDEPGGAGVSAPGARARRR